MTTAVFAARPLHYVPVAGADLFSIEALEHADLTRWIQIASRDARYDGACMRAFDLKHDEYFGNNGDTGWGPYCIESGWTVAITASGLLLSLLNESIFD